MKVHLRIKGGKVVCGYNRWRGGSMVLTSTGNPAAVTCLRCQRFKHAE